MGYKVAFQSLGCAKNLVNTEQMMALCRDAGHTVTGDPEGADVAVLNTCGFIESAKSEAIDNIIQLGELKQAGKLKKLLHQWFETPAGRFPSLPAGSWPPGAQPAPLFRV